MLETDDEVLLAERLRDLVKSFIDISDTNRRRLAEQNLFFIGTSASEDVDSTMRSFDDGNPVHGETIDDSVHDILDKLIAKVGVAESLILDRAGLQDKINKLLEVAVGYE